MLRTLTPLLLLLPLLLLPVACSPPLEWRTRGWEEKRRPAKLLTTDWGEKAKCSFGDGGTVTEGTDLVIKTHDSNCTMKRCLKTGQVLSIEVQCHALPCVDPLPKKGACCKYCKEVNCRLPDGKLIKGEKSVRFGRQLCGCPKSHGRGQKTRPAWGQVDLTVAECHDLNTPAPTTTTTTTTTTPVPHCRLPEERGREKEEKEEEEGTSGGLLEPGQERIVPKGDECRKYVCDARGQLTTFFSQCPSLNCSEGNAPIRREGACCKSCPGGKLAKPRFSTSRHRPTTKTPNQRYRPQYGNRRNSGQHKKHCNHGQRGSHGMGGTGGEDYEEDWQSTLRSYRSFGMGW